MRTSLFYAVALTAFASGATIASPAAHGQTLIGRVLATDSSSGVANVVVVALSSTGARVASALTTRTGAYLLQFPSKGTYSIRATRIGFRPSPGVTVLVLDADTVKHDVLLQEVPVRLPELKSTADAQCDLSGKDADAFVQLWDQASAALAGVGIADLSRRTMTLVRREGRVDAVGYNAPDEVGVPAVFWKADRTREVLADGSLAATPATTLRDSGYVRSRGSGTVYDIPSPSALLSDAFLNSHCFGISSKKADHVEAIGLTFRPKTVRVGIADIRGTIWLARQSIELQSVDFVYTSVPRTEWRMCEADQPQDPVRKVCKTFREDGQNRIGAGGTVEFSRTPMGLIVSAATLRTPSDEWNLRESKKRVRHLRGDSCNDRVVRRQMRRAGDCVYLLMPVPRLDVTVHRVAQIVTRDGMSYADSLSHMWMQEATATKGGRQGTISGSVLAENGMPVPGASVQVEGRGRVSLSDRSGLFEIGGLLPGSIHLVVGCGRSAVARVELTLAADSTHRVRFVLPSSQQTTECM